MLGCASTHWRASAPSSRLSEDADMASSNRSAARDTISVAPEVSSARIASTSARWRAFISLALRRPGRKSHRISNSRH